MDILFYHPLHHGQGFLIGQRVAAEQPDQILGASFQDKPIVLIQDRGRFEQGAS